MRGMHLRDVFDSAHSHLWEGTPSGAKALRVGEWWVSMLGDVDGTSITPAQVLRALGSPGLSGRPLSTATRRRYLARLKTALAHALGAAAPQLPTVPRGPRRTRVLGPEELEALLGSFACPASRDLARFLAATGCRLGEALAAGARGRRGSWERSGVVTFLNTKSGRDRTVPLSSEAADAARGGWWGLTETYFRRAWRVACVRAGLGPDVTPHVLRHTAITRMVRAGVPLPVVQEIVGHADIHTTMQYTHVDSDDLAKAVEALA